MRELLSRYTFLLLALLVFVVVVPGSVLAQVEQDELPTFEDELPTFEDELPTFEYPADQPKAAPGEIIVKFKENVSPSRQAENQRQEGLEKLEDLDLIGAGLYKVEGQSVERAIQDLNRLHREVEYAEPNRKVYPTQYANEPSFGQLWGLDNTGQKINNVSGTPDMDINAKEASAVTQGDPNLVVAVIDDGVDFSHPELANRAWTNPGESGNSKETNGKDDDANGYVDDVNGWDFYRNDKTVQDAGDKHGTHLAGTIAASLNVKDVVGVAPNIKIMALKVMGTDSNGVISGSTSDAITALSYAKSKGVKISNNSWSYKGSPLNSLKQAIEASGQLFVASAGNGGSNNDADPNNTYYPASYDSPNILSVASIDNTGKLASSSNYGLKTVDISAPGERILSTTPGNSFQSWNGTSMAAAHTTGAAALVASKRPWVLNYPPVQLKYHLMKTGKPAPATAGKTVTAKVINAHAAVTQQVCVGEGSAYTC